MEAIVLTCQSAEPMPSFVTKICRDVTSIKDITTSILLHFLLIFNGKSKGNMQMYIYTEIPKLFARDRVLLYDKVVLLSLIL